MTEDAVGSLFVIVLLITVFTGVGISAFVSWIKDKPKDYAKVCKAIADALSMPMFIKENLAHNRQQHKRGLKTIAALSDTDAVEVEIQNLLREIAISRVQTETIEQLSSLETGPGRSRDKIIAAGQTE